MIFRPHCKTVHLGTKTKLDSPGMEKIHTDAAKFQGSYPSQWAQGKNVAFVKKKKKHTHTQDNILIYPENHSSLILGTGFYILFSVQEWEWILKEDSSWFKDEKNRSFEKKLIILLYLD